MKGVMLGLLIYIGGTAHVREELVTRNQQETSEQKSLHQVFIFGLPFDLDTTKMLMTLACWR